jgi:hypothetical protein
MNFGNIFFGKSIINSGLICLSFLASSHHEKPEAQTNSKLVVQLLKSQKVE